MIIIMVNHGLMMVNGGLMMVYGRYNELNDG